MTKEEQWKPIKGFEGLYDVSNIGRVRSVTHVIERIEGIKKTIKGRILKQSEYRGGYLNVLLSANGHNYHAKVHRLVAIAFVPNPEKKPYVDHINGIRTDNRTENLRWCTHSENNSFDLARKHFSEGSFWRGKKGAKSPFSKRVAQYTKEGIFLRVFDGLSEAQRETGIREGNISLVCKGYRHSAGGFLWKIVE